MNFVIRVELHDQGRDSLAYDRLHGAMLEKGVLRTIVGSDGLKYELPNAMYSYVGNFSPSAVRDWIKAIVDGLGYQSWILVTGGESAWLLEQRR